MAELGPGDLPASTRSRYTNDAAAQSAIDAALAAARRYCGWFVSPVQTDVEMDLDGPGGRVLSLPTLNLIGVTSIVELGQDIDVSKLDVSRQKGTVEKYPFGHWSSRNGAIVATVTHGYTETEAADFRAAVVQIVTTASLAQSTTRDSLDLKRKKVDDVEYEWYDALISSDEQLAAKFSAFRILPSP